MTIQDNKQTNKVLDSTTYVTTENMLPNRGGVEFPVKKLPKNIKKINTYKKGDILISNIRPYFKKIWLADRDGSCSGDVLIFRSANKELLQEFLYLVLQTDNFFEYMTVTSKGTKMPRGDKEAISEFKFNLPNIEVQKDICQKLLLLERKIKLNKEINANLAQIKSTLFTKLFNDHLKTNLNGTLSDLAKIQTGKRPKIIYEKLDKSTLYPVVGASKVMGYTNDYLYNESIITTGRVGTHGIIQRFQEPVWVSDNSFVILTEHEDYIFEILSHRVNYGSLNTGSTQPLITQTTLSNIDIYIPTSEELYEFEVQSTPITDIQFTLKEENIKLENIKRTLLKKFII